MTEPGDYTQHERKCGCGGELLFHCQARTGVIVARRFGVCPDCDAEHDLPDNVLRVFRMVEGKWVPAY
jgi:hypothetical protein